MMLRSNGEMLLRQFSATAYPPTITEVSETVYHVMGVGQSNAAFIIADDSVILIDALNAMPCGEALRDIIAEKTTKPVKTLIYTHQHIDHTGGATAFQDTLETIIAFSSTQPSMPRTEIIQPELTRRTIRQFGFNLSDDEAISMGVSNRLGLHAEVKPLLPNKLYHDDTITLTIDGVTLCLSRAIGETNDHISIWYDEQKILFSGDNYYACWPNLYALRGTPYRDLNLWIETLDTLRAYPADALLPGHTKPLLSASEIQATLQDYRNAIDFVLNATLQGMSEGQRMDTLAETVVLPHALAQRPFLGEYYGCIEWSVKGIYAGYVGWFDGNPTSLHPLKPSRGATKILDLIGSRKTVLDEAEKSLTSDPQWAAELADLILDDDVRDEKARFLKAAALEALAELETRANGRHYYLVYAKELRNGSCVK